MITPLAQQIAAKKVLADSVPVYLFVLNQCFKKKSLICSKGQGVRIVMHSMQRLGAQHAGM
jgi:hypothetical protein